MKVSKNTYLALVLVLLIAVSVFLGFWERGSGAKQFDTGLFVIENIDQVNRLVITNGENVMDCRAFPGGFIINGQYSMDENLLTLLAAVLQQVRVQRPLEGQQAEQIWKSIEENGSHIEVFNGDVLLSSFWSGGDAAAQNSYFATDEGQVYLVHLPGYTSYVSGLFALAPREWRSRTIFSNTWRSLMSFSYQDFTHPENDFQINYRDPFFAVPGVQQLDSNNVINYLEQVVNLKAVSLIDTTLNEVPTVEIVTTDIDPAKNQTLILFGDLNRNPVLGKSGDQYFTFRTSSIQGITRNAEYFEKK